VREYFAATFSSLRIGDYRLYAFGQTVSVSGTWMQKLAQAWLVLELTNSGVLLGITAACQQLPTLLFTTKGGVLADRFDTRKILIWTSIAAAAPAALLGGLVLAHHVAIWMVMAAALVQGCADALDKPARLTIVNELVDEQHLTNAVTLNSVIQNSGKVAGPAVAGILIGSVGLAPAFLINAASYLPVIAALIAIRSRTPGRTSPLGARKYQLKTTLSYIRGHAAIAATLLLMTVAGLLAYNWTVLLPLLVRTTFHGDAQDVGFAFTAMGLGAIVGGLAVAGSLSATSQALLGTGLVFSCLTLMLALSPTVVAVYGTLFVLGGASVAFRATATSLLQLRSDPAMRGRVISLLVLATAGTTPISGPIVGWICQAANPRIACVVAAVGTGAAVVATGLYLARRRRVSAPEQASDVRVDSSAVDSDDRYLA
jgi:MFS family permease